MPDSLFKNPFRPGAGHPPPYLAGREDEKLEFLKLLKQDTVLDNLVLMGLRGVGKTVLLAELKPLAIQQGWMRVGTGLSEFSSSHVNQMLASLGSAGLVYKNRHGRYSFAVPLLGQFIRRQPI